MNWKVETLRAPASAIHSRPLPEVFERTVFVCLPDRPALVLGSAQSESAVNVHRLREHDVELVRRTSGGGAVLVEPDALAWIDVMIPSDDALWSDDVGQAFMWLGDTWCEALEPLGIKGKMHEGALVRDEWSDLVCFAGLGPGEVTFEGAKVVGLSQKRVRAGAMFHGSALLRWEPERLVELLELPDAERSRALAAVRPRASAISDVSGDDIVNALIRVIAAR